MFFDKNEKLETIKDLLGSRATYHDTIQVLELNEEEKDILMRASIEVKKGNPDLKIIDRAYAILVGKSFQGENVEENTASDKPYESKAKEEKDTTRTILDDIYKYNPNVTNSRNRIMQYMVIIALIMIIIFPLLDFGDYNRVHIGESTTVEYTYDGTGDGRKIIRNVKVNVANNYAKYARSKVGYFYNRYGNYGHIKDRDIEVTIKNLEFDVFILNNDQIYQMEKGSIIKNGGMYLPRSPKDDRIEILAGETGSFFVRVENYVDKIYIKKPNKEGGIKTVLTLDVPKWSK